jgi:truncated hemoglobin YjbI
MTKMKEFYEKVANDKELQTKFFEIIRDAEMAVEQATEEKLTGFAK